MSIVGNVWNSVTSAVSTGVTSVEHLLGIADGDSGAKQPNPAASTSNTPTETPATPDTPTSTPVPTASKYLVPGRRLKNPLGYFSSYNYQISLYMVSPQAYATFIASGRRHMTSLATGKSIEGAILIAQSGGINNKQENRAPGFNFDYYIDNLTLEMTGFKESGSAVATTTYSLNITEPYGFSFISNLSKASKSLQSNAANGPVNPAKNFFILGIKFLGYDASGNLMNGNSIVGGERIDPGADGSSNLFERYYDIIITEMKSTIDGKAMVYHISGSTTQSQAFSSLRGIIGKDVPMTTATVGEALNLLMINMSKQQQEIYAKSTKGPLVQYAVQFIGIGGDLIEGAKMATPDDLDKFKWPGSTATNPTQSNPALEVRSSPDNTARTITVKNGTPILQAIDQIITLSDYAKSALTVLFDSSLEPVNGEVTTLSKDKDAPKVIRWFSCCAEISNIVWNSDVKDWNYTITYLIQPYSTPITDSILAKSGGTYYGPFKKYEYWYTGKNSEILSYSQTLSTAYFNVVINDLPNSTPTGGSDTTVSTASGQTTQQPNQGTLGPTAEAVNNYKASLFDPSAQVEATVHIMGDPDFLASDASPSDDSLYNTFYGTDGYTMNPNSGMTFFEIDFKEAVDYSIGATNDTNATGGITGEPGTLSLNDSIQFWNPGQSDIKGLTYMLVTASSSFSGGKFTQTLKGNMHPIPMPEGVQQAEGRPPASDVPGTSKSTGPTPGNANTAQGKDNLKPDPPPDVTNPANQNNAPDVSGGTTTTRTTTRYADGTVVVETTTTGPVANDDGSQANTIPSQIPQSAAEAEANGRAPQSFNPTATSTPVNISALA